MGNPAPEARKRVQGGLNPQSCAALWAAGGSMGSDAFYSVRGFFGKSRAGGALESRLSLPHLCSAPAGRGGFYGKQCIL